MLQFFLISLACMKKACIKPETVKISGLSDF